MKHCLLLLVCLFGMTSFAQESTIKGKTVLFVYGGWEGHEPEKCRDVFVPWMENEGASEAFAGQPNQANSRSMRCRWWNFFSIRQIVPEIFCRFGNIV